MNWWKRIREGMGKPRCGSRFGTEVAVRTDVGCAREENEDSVLFVRPQQRSLQASRGVLAIVADGMGGANTGEIASRIAGQTISELYFATHGSPGRALSVAYAAANRRIFEMAAKQPGCQGMGTTAAALVLIGGEAWFANIGDSRLYLVRDGCLHQLSQDDSLVAQMVRDGLLTAEQARGHQDRNILIRALGTKPELKLGCQPAVLECRPGDRFLLCSDGLYDLVSDQEMVAAAMRDIHSAADMLIEIAKGRGGPDNISLILIAVRQQPVLSKAVETRELEPLAPETREALVGH
jgi:PPM family protein phosphatase